MLITGGTGLLALNWSLVARDNYLVTLCTHNRTVSLPGTTQKSIDLKSVDQILRAFDVLSPKIVVHAAGLTNIEICEADPSLAHEANVVTASNVALAAKKLGIKLVHISTDHLFDGGHAFTTEDSPVSPINVYGRTKAEAEKRVLEANPEALIIRTNFYAWGPSYRCSFSDTIINTLRAGHNINLFQDILYTPILVEVAVQNIHRLIDRNATGIFNIVGDERISKYEFGLKIAEEFNLDISKISCAKVSSKPNLIRRPKDMSLSNSKVSDLLGRNIGGVREHINRLHQQECSGFAQEIREL